jgi:hypothetical protein
VCAADTGGRSYFAWMGQSGGGALISSIRGGERQFKRACVRYFSRTMCSSN